MAFSALLGQLEPNHQRFLETALRNVLTADITQTTFGELLVGSPLLRTLLDTRDSHIPPGDPLLRALPSLPDSLIRYVQFTSYDKDFDRLPMWRAPFFRYWDTDISSPNFNNILVETTTHVIGIMAISFLKMTPDEYFRGEWEQAMPTMEQLQDLFPSPATVPHNLFQLPGYHYHNPEDGPLDHSMAAIWAINRIFGGVPWVNYLNPSTSHPATGLVNGDAPHTEPLWFCSDRPGAPQGF